MSEIESKVEAEKPLRTKDQVQAEYEMCAKHLGDKSYRIDLMAQECLKIKERMFQLNNEKLAEPAPELVPSQDELEAGVEVIESPQGPVLVSSDG